MNECKDIQLLVVDGLCGELEAADAAKVELHLDTCSACAAFAREMTALSGDLTRSLHAFAPEPTLDAGHRAAIRAEEMRMIQLQRRRRIWYATAAALLCIGAAGIALLPFVWQEESNALPQESSLVMSAGYAAQPRVLHAEPEASASSARAAKVTAAAPAPMRMMAAASAKAPAERIADKVNAMAYSGKRNALILARSPLDESACYVVAAVPGGGESIQVEFFAPQVRGVTEFADQLEARESGRLLTYAGTRPWYRVYRIELAPGVSGAQSIARLHVDRDLINLSAAGAEVGFLNAADDFKVAVCAALLAAEPERLDSALAKTLPGASENSPNALLKSQMGKRK